MAEVELEENNAVADLSAAWDEHTEQEETDSGHEEVQYTEEGGSAEEPTEHEPSDTTVSEDDSAGVPESGEGTESAEEPDSPPPVSLSATAKEAWKDTPKAMKEEIAKRERDFSVGIQRYAEGAKRAQAMDQALQPFQQYFAVNGGNPGQQITTLLQTASALQMGSPLQKAQTVADIISQFGVDVESLDKMLVGEAPDPQAQIQTTVQQQVEQALAPYRQREQQEQQAAQQRQQQVYSEAGHELQQFSADPANEFYTQVRGDMADILDLAAQRGMQMPLKEAYRRACLLNNDIQAKIQAKNKQQIQAKKAAASSISGSLGGAVTQEDPTDVRGVLEQAWNNYESV